MHLTRVQQSKVAAKRMVASGVCLASSFLPVVLRMMMPLAGSTCVSIKLHCVLAADRCEGVVQCKEHLI